jgi:hypothetical protein
VTSMLTVARWVSGVTSSDDEWAMVICETRN